MSDAINREVYERLSVDEKIQLAQDIWGDVVKTPDAIEMSQAQLEEAERRGSLRLDWFAGRRWGGGRGITVTGLDGPGKASDHAPSTAEFE